MAIFVVTYTYTTGESDVAARDELRPAHKRFLDHLGDLGINRCSGPFGTDEAPGALLLINAESKDEAVRFTDADPFRVNGLVATVSAREWIPMLGPLATELAPS